MFGRKKIEDMDLTLGSTYMLLQKSECKHKRVHKVHDIWNKEYLFCINCKRTLWGWYEGKRLWASLEKPFRHGVEQ